MPARSPEAPRRAPRPALTAAALAAALVLGAAHDASAQSRIAVVALQYAVMQTEDGIRAQATLKKLFDRRQQDLDAKQSELVKARDDIDKQARVLSREALAKRMEDWQRQMIELQTVFVDYNKELQKKQGELTAPIMRKMTEVIARVAKKQNYDLILDRQAAPYARTDLDLTEQVVQLYNSGGAGAEPAEAPAENKGEKKDENK